MIITEEEFREQRKIAIHTLEEFKKREAVTTMKRVKIGNNTWLYETEKDHKSQTKKKKYRHVLPSERVLEEFFIDSLFGDETDEIVYIF